MTFDMVYKVLAKGFEIRRHGSEMTKYRLHKNGKELMVNHKLLDNKTWVESRLSMNGFDIMATDWEIVPKDINK
jgi:hypothetical protein